jgi:hypothetical protein
MERPAKAKIDVRVVAYKEGDTYVAQCLEHDICVQAPTLSALQRRFDKVIIASFCACSENNTAFNDAFPPAPREFWDMYDRAETLVGLTDEDSRPGDDLPLVVPKVRLLEQAA